MIVIEDVDIIASARNRVMGEEMALNNLLNEMDGLRQDADVLVVLTTNRPDKLEPALASRPGRIDQAIEFPLPDDQCRARLIKLYARGLTLSEELTDVIARRTKGASAAFIKELMRRSAQFHFETGGNGALHQSALDGALEEMLFSGGSLNLNLLGGSNIGFRVQDAS
jgi:ATP-dependent 26S proteasome regulatory subunit